MSDWDIVEECLGECDSSRFFDRALAEHRKMRDELTRLREALSDFKQHGHDECIAEAEWLKAEQDRFKHDLTLATEALRQLSYIWGAERDQLKAERDRLQGTLVFFASVIKSGEPWTDKCERAYLKAMSGKEGKDDE